MQCDVHRNADDPTGQIPWLIDVQSTLFSALETRVAVRLIRATAFGRRATRLHPAFVVEGNDVVLPTHLIAAIRERSLGPTIASLADQRDTVLSAIDVRWSGV
jgi:toxin CcdB